MNSRVPREARCGDLHVRSANTSTVDFSSIEGAQVVAAGDLTLQVQGCCARPVVLAESRALILAEGIASNFS